MYDFVDFESSFVKYFISSLKKHTLFTKMYKVPFHSPSAVEVDHLGPSRRAALASLALEALGTVLHQLAVGVSL